MYDVLAICILNCFSSGLATFDKLSLFWIELALLTVRRALGDEADFLFGKRQVQKEREKEGLQE